MNWDVIVVGAGPAGCAAAALLAREGVHTLLLEKSSAPPPKVCGEYLSPGCLRILEGLGALHALRAAGAQPIHGMRVHTARGRSWHALYPRSRQRPGAAHGLAIPRETLDRLLLGIAVESGAHYLPGFQVSDLLWEGKGVVGIRGRQDGRAASTRGRLVVGADGRNSVVARRLGGVTRPGWLDKLALVAHMEGVQRADDAGEIFLGADRYAILNPIGPGLTNVGLVLSRRDFCPDADPAGFLEEMAGTLPGLAARLAFASLLGSVRRLGPLAHRANRLTAPGCLLVGDAAGFLDPFTGEGIYAGLRSAELAARFAVPELGRSRSAAPALQAYSVAWTREIASRWRLCSWLQHAVRRPRLADRIVALLAGSPALATRVAAAIGNLTPADD